MSDLHGLSGLYALDALDDVERKRFEQHLEGCEECRQEVAGFHDTAATLAAADEDQPPASLRASVLSNIATTRQERPPVVPVPHRARRAAPWILAAAALVAALVLGTGLLRARDDANRLREIAAILGAPDADVTPLAGPAGMSARFVSSSSADAGVLVVAGLDEAPDGRTYQLWFIDDGGPESAGLFRPDADGDVRFRTDAAPPGTAAIGITEEPAGGSSAPTGAILVAGEVT